MNVPTNATPEEEIPDQAKGNPVYEQTRQDMPLWCCGTNCGRNSRMVVFLLGLVGIACSSFVCLSPRYFSFVSTRNDTFTDPDKLQPHPFEYATEANVGLFRYEILEVYEYPWPPKNERELFDAMHERELKRLDAIDVDVDVDNNEVTTASTINTYMNRLLNRLLPNKFPDDFYDDDNLISSQTMDDDNVNEGDDLYDDDNVISSQIMDDDNVNNNKITSYQNDTTSLILTRSPSDTPYDESIPTSLIPDVLPGSNADVRLPTTSPTPSPTMTNPNDLIDVDIGVVKPYPAGAKFDSLFSNGQMGAMWAPILATVGLISCLVEFCCCEYKCSWLPTAICLYGAFMLQLMTVFLFMSEDFCKYDQDCALGFSGLLSVVAVMAYMIAQMLVCMTPRPPPIYNLCKKPPVKRKKKKKKKTPDEFDEKWGLVDDDDEDGFADEPDGYVDPYSDDGGRDGHRDGDDDDIYQQEDPYDTNGYVDPYNNDGDDEDYQEEPYDTSNNEYSDDYEYGDDQEPYGEATGEGENNDDYDDYDYQETEGRDERRRK